MAVYPAAMFILGEMVFDEDRERAISLYKRSAEKGYKDAVDRLAELGLETPEKA